MVMCFFLGVEVLGSDLYMESSLGDCRGCEAEEASSSSVMCHDVPKRLLIVAGRCARGLGFRVGFRISVFGFRISGLRFKVSGFSDVWRMFLRLLLTAAWSTQKP